MQVGRGKEGGREGGREPDGRIQKEGRKDERMEGGRDG